MPSKRDVRNNSAPSEFAYLGLHQAALSGNVGLVQYALSQGQPVDAIWDGISALHAAAAGGSEHVARLLIESGADVSLGRLPRNERELKTRTASSSSSTPMEKGPDSSLARNPRGEREFKPRSASSSSTSAPDALLNPGSTPLHFACAHNHVAVARVLLSYGAAPHIRDRCGVTPVDLLSPASDLLRTVIREYYEAEKAKEKEYQKNHGVRFYGKAAAVLGFPREEDANGARGVGVKRSYENLLTKSPKHIPAPLGAPSLSPGRRIPNSIGTPPPSPRRPSVPASERVPPSPTSPSRFSFGSAMTASPSFGSAGAPTPPRPPPPDFSPPPVMDQRRPSLPHLFDQPSPSPPPLPPAAAEDRPSSAGSGYQPPAFGSPSSAATAPVFNTAGNARPRTKRSLLSLFKKGECATQEAPTETPGGEHHDRACDKEWARERPVMVSAKSAPPMRSSPRRRGSELDELADARAEVHTAPAGRTTFSTNHARVAEDVFSDEDDDDVDEYGIPLTGTPDPLPPELPDSPPYSDYDEESGDEEFDGEETVEDDGALDPALQLDRASTGATVRPRDRFVPPRHAEAWYRDRIDAARGAPLGLAESDTTPPPTSRPGILRNDHSVRQTGSRGALRFEAQQQETLRERGSRSSLRARASRERLLAVGTDGRMRGDSVSSASTDASAPARSHVSQDTTTGTMTSTNSSVPPPPPLREGYGDALLLDLSEGEDEGAGRGLSIRTVSNHAQAEALVQKAAKEILELNVAAADAESAPSLSAQLAAYGETLQLERRFARGEAQRFKSPIQERFEVEGGETDDELEQRREERREEERKRKAQEKMVRTQREMERYARDRDGFRDGFRDKKGLEMLYGEMEARAIAGVPLVRTASLEKEMEVGAVTRPPKTRQPKMRRPHTSDSVASGNSAPPRFGHSTTYSSSSVLRGHDATESLRGLNRERRAHHFSRSASAHPRAESLDHERRNAQRPDEPVSAPLARYDSRDDPDLQLSTTGSSKSSAANRSAFPLPALGFDEFGASTTSIRPAKQRFGGLRSLFGKGK